MAGVAALAIALAWGTLAATRLGGSRTLAERLGLGIALGLALELWLPFLLAVPLGVRAGSIAALWVSCGLLGFEVGRNRAGGQLLADEVRARLAPGRLVPSLAHASVLSVSAAFLAFLAGTHSLWSRPDGLWTAGYGFGDTAMHATFARSFLHGPGVAPPRYPLFSGWAMTYPFAPDFAVASLESLGLSLGGAFGLTLALALVAVLLLLVSLARRWTGRGAIVGLAAAALFFASGGLSAWEVAARLLTGTDPWTAVTTNDITQLADSGYVLNNVTNGILLPARNAAFGMALGAAALVLLIRVVDEGRAARGDGVVGGVLVGLLPMVHTHSFLALGLVATSWAVTSLASRRREALGELRLWASVLVPIGVVALPQVLWVAWGLRGAASFSSAQLGWESNAFPPGATGLAAIRAGVLAWLWFWLKNAGLFGVLSVAAFALGTPRERALAAPFALVFFLCNLGHLQPWSHDNVKLFAWVWLAFAPLVAGLLARAWRHDLPGKALAVQGLVLACATGALVLAREATLEIRLVGTDAIEFADQVRAKTGPEDVILTANAHNHPVPMLAGRVVVLGYKGWLWPHGVPYQEREAQVERIYTAKKDARALLDSLGVGWVVVGPDERTEYPSLDERAIARICGGEPPLLFGIYHLYRVRRP